MNSNKPRSTLGRFEVALYVSGEFVRVVSIETSRKTAERIAGKLNSAMANTESHYEVLDMTNVTT